MSTIFSYVPAAPANAPPSAPIISASDVLQALVDYVAQYLGETLYNLTVVILGAAYMWMFMEMSGPGFKEQLDAFFA